MSPELVSALGVIGAAIITVGGVVYTTRVTRVAQQRTEELERDKVDAAAYQRARESLEATIVRLNDEISRLDRQVKALRLALDDEQADNHALRRTLLHIEQTVEQLHELLRRAGVNVPSELGLLPRLATPNPPPRDSD